MKMETKIANSKILGGRKMTIMTKNLPHKTATNMMEVKTLQMMKRVIK